MPDSRRSVCLLAAAALFFMPAVPARAGAVLPAPQEAAAAPAWSEFRSAEGRFVVTMPATPTPDVKTTDTAVGKIQMHSFSIETPAIYCSVAYYDVPTELPLEQSADKFLDSTCDGFVQGGKLSEKVGRRAITLDGHPGRELMGETPDGGFVLLARYYVVGKRVYLVMTGVPVGDGASPQVSKFLGSFRLLG
jgi:hypothetical protein